jgi:methionine aminopeptidase
VSNKTRVAKEERIDLLNELKEKSQLQSKVINEGRVSSLERLINKKQELIDKIDKLSNSFKQQPGFSEVESKILKEIKEIDEKNSGLLEEKVSQLKKIINKLQKGKKATTNYHKKLSPSGGVFLDKRH